MDDKIEHILIEFDPNGSLATTHESQGSDMGLFGGFLGWDATDERLVNSAEAIREAGIRVDFRITQYGATHPNTYKLTLANSDQRHEMTAISTGGGMIEVTEIDGAQVSIAGDFYETLVYVNANPDEVNQYLSDKVDSDEILVHAREQGHIIEIKAQQPLQDEVLSRLQSEFDIDCIKRLAPVLPVMSSGDLRVPFITCEEMLKYNEARSLSLWALAVHYESDRGCLPHEEVLNRMTEIVRVLRKSIDQGIQGTEYTDRILGCQSGNYKALMDKGKLLGGDMVNRIILNVTAMMEVKSSMGLIVAAPTAGACAALPGACIGAAEVMELSEDDMVKAMLAAGMIGVFIAVRATFSAEVGGCQAECGSASGMAAAALVTLAGGNTHQAISAASMALQNSMGMVCDPVANRVEVPCLGKNVMAAVNALACANMALADYDAVITLDEVIETMDRIGHSIPCELRCTALGGLSITKTSKEIEKRLKKNMI